MIGPRPKWFRYLIIAFWNIICPIGVLVIKSIYFYGQCEVSDQIHMSLCLNQGCYVER